MSLAKENTVIINCLLLFGTLLLVSLLASSFKQHLFRIQDVLSIMLGGKGL